MIILPQEESLGAANRWPRDFAMAGQIGAQRDCAFPRGETCLAADAEVSLLATWRGGRAAECTTLLR